MKNLYIIIALIACSALRIGAQDEILEGDLLFAYSTTTGKAISAATVHDSSALPIYHVAIATWVGGKLYALEAIDEGVALTPFEDFKQRTMRLFPLINMSFHDSNGHILDYWREHYAKHGMAVPEGALGTNPAQIANDPAIEIYNPSMSSKKSHSASEIP